MASTTFAIVLFALCLAAGLEASTPFKSCKTVADPSEFRLEGCTQHPCNLYKGEDAKAEWDFVVSADTETLIPRVRAMLFGSIGIDYNIGQANACDTLTNAKCPLKEGQIVTYGLTMPVLSSYPTISMTIEFALLGDNNDAQVCFQVPAKVTSR